MKKTNQIRCAECRYTAADANASEYTQKRCGKCERRENCEIKKTGGICDKQILKWAAIQCACADSEYHRSLLNVTTDGSQLDFISWSGCEYGERRDG